MWRREIGGGRVLQQPGANISTLTILRGSILKIHYIDVTAQTAVCSPNSSQHTVSRRFLVYLAASWSCMVNLGEVGMMCGASKPGS